MSTGNTEWQRKLMQCVREEIIDSALIGKKVILCDFRGKSHHTESVYGTFLVLSESISLRSNDIITVLFECSAFEVELLLRMCGRNLTYNAQEILLFIDEVEKHRIS
jgi:hypothetical protein